MRAVLTVVGADTVGIMAKISAVCAEHQVNIVDVTQTIMQDLFCMIMLCEIDQINIAFDRFVDECTAVGKQNDLVVHVMHEDIFNSMHRI